MSVWGEICREARRLYADQPPIQLVAVHALALTGALFALAGIALICSVIR